MWSLATSAHIVAWVLMAMLIAMVVVALLLQHLPYLMMVAFYVGLAVFVILVVLARFFQHTCSLCPPRTAEEIEQHQRVTTQTSVMPQVIGTIVGIVLAATGAYTGVETGFVR